MPAVALLRVAPGRRVWQSATQSGAWVQHGRSLAVLAAAIGLGAAGSLLPTQAAFSARAFAWVLAAVAALTAGVRQRPEPAASWQVMAIGHTLIGAAWLARSIDSDLGTLGSWPDVPAGVGLIVIGVGLLLAGRDRRERVGLLDGAILAGAVLVFIWATLIDPRVGPATTDAQLTGSVLHVTGAVLGVSVMVAISLSGRVQLTRSTIPAAVGVAFSLFAGVGWAWQGLIGQEQGPLGAASWLVAPLLAAAVPFTRDRSFPLEPARAQLLTPARFGLLVLLTLMPALTVGILGTSPGDMGAEVPTALGLWVTSASVVLLAARIRLTAGFAVEDERVAGDVRHQRLVEHSADLVALLSPTGIVFYTSPAMVRTLGREQHELVGRTFGEVVAAEDRDAFAVVLGRAADLAGSPLPVRLRVHDADGALLPTEGTITDLTGVDGVEGVVVTLRDVSERMALEEELRRAALEDPLTGLANRTLLTDRARHALAQRDAEVGFLYLDVDDFKTINDGLGHHAGDHVLQVVADRIRAVVREADTPGRIGGDEFAVLLEGLEGDDPEGAATVVAQRMLHRMQEPIEVAGETVRVRASVGLALGRAGMSVDELVQNADVAMYSAKESGRDFALYDERMETRARRRLLLTQDLEAALRDGTVRLGYQPIVDLATRRLVAVEALLRWEHPRLGPIAASEMEELAVRGGLADDLTRWTFQRVQRDRAAWQRQFGDRLVVAVNLAAQQLSDQVVELFEQAFGDRLAGSSPAIQIELTESALLRDAKRAAGILGELRRRGATIAIDDFGTGYASLSYLRRLPVDVLKIDREFIAELDGGEVKGTFAALIRDLARTLGLVTVAEGIETEEQCAAAVTLGCERGQGWLFGAAASIGDLAVDQAMRGDGAVRLPGHASR